MTRRERFENLVNHKPLDRPVFDLCGSPQTKILDQSKVEEIKRLLHIKGDYTGPGLFDERILQALNIDTRMTGGFPVPDNKNAKTLPDGYVDEWGIVYRAVNGHYEIAENPLKDKTLEEIQAFPFPKAGDIDRKLFEQYREHARNLYEDTDYIVVAQHPCYGVLELGCWMFGFDDFLYRLAGEPETVQWFFDKILAYQKELIALYYGALGEYIHCTTSGDDFGTQHGLFMSIPMFEEMVAPYYKERISYTKQFTKAYYQHHTCGSVFRLIPTLISCGIDILNPIQPGAFEMEPERLKACYGDKISFWGGVDTQDLLVNRNAAEIKAEVKRILGIFGKDGGYILSPAHCIQNDIPAENVIAIYQAANEMYPEKSSIQ